MLYNIIYHYLLLSHIIFRHRCAAVLGELLFLGAMPLISRFHCPARAV